MLLLGYLDQIAPNFLRAMRPLSIINPNPPFSFDFHCYVNALIFYGRIQRKWLTLFHQGKVNMQYTRPPGTCTETDN